MDHGLFSPEREIWRERSRLSQKLCLSLVSSFLPLSLRVISSTFFVFSLFLPFVTTFFSFWGERGNISNFKYCYLQHALQIPDEGVCLQQLFYPVVSSYHSVIGHGWIEEEVTFSLSKDVKLPTNGGQLRNPCRYVTNKCHLFAGELIPTTDEVLLFVKSGFRHLRLLMNCPRKTFSYVANFLFPICCSNYSCQQRTQN